MDLPFQITVCGLGELSEHREARLTHVLSVLDPGVPSPVEFDGLPARRRMELRFHDIVDEHPEMQCPRAEHIERLLQFVQQVSDECPAGGHLLVHCHAGFSRSPASAVLIMAKLRPELPSAALITELLRIRPRVWPNLRMLEIGDELLARGGDIVRAVRQLYRYLLERDPGLDQLIRSVGRERELEAAVKSADVPG